MSIKENYERLLIDRDRACKRVGRNPSEIQLMAVCKSQSPQAVMAAWDCGIRLFGENRLQEAESHIPQLAGKDSEWHFIGRLQKNKINKILQVFSLIQSVDGVKNLEHIQKRVSQPIKVFLEINIGEEKTKSGFAVEGLKKAISYISQMNNVIVSGLMTIPPYSENPEDSRPYYASMKRLQDEIVRIKIDNINLRHLSMGMSNDFEVAIEEGATILRIGTALFGKRLL